MLEKSKKTKIKQTRVTDNFDIVNAMINAQASKADPDGSYTGKPIVEGEAPIQDGDDI